MATQEDIQDVKSTFQCIMELKYLLEPELSMSMEHEDIKLLYENLYRMEQCFTIFMEKGNLVEDVEWISAINKQMRLLYPYTLDYIEQHPYSDYYKSFFLHISNVIMNYCNMYLEEGKSTFICSIHDTFVSLKEKWQKISDRLNLNMSTQELIMKTSRLLQMAEDTISVFGAEDNLLSVSEHFMESLRSLNRQDNDCKIEGKGEK